MLDLDQDDGDSSLSVQDPESWEVDGSVWGRYQSWDLWGWWQCLLWAALLNITAESALDYYLRIYQLLGCQQQESEI